MKFQQEDGTFRASDSKKSQATVVSASHAYYIISQLNNLALGENLEKLKEGFNSLLEELDFADDKTLSFGEKLIVPTTSRLLYGYFALPIKAGESVVEASQVSGFLKLLLDNKAVSSIDDAYHVYLGLVALDKNPKGKAILIENETPYLSDSSNGKITLNIVSEWNEPVKATGTLVKSTMNGEEVLTNVKGEVSKDKIILPVFKDGKAGTYDLKVDIAASTGYLSYKSYELSITVTTGIKITDAKINVSGGKDVIAKYPKKVEGTISADPSSVITVTFSVTSNGGEEFKPQQTFVQLIHKSGIQYTTVAYDRKDGFTASINLKDNSIVSEGFRYISGEYQAYILVGDTSIQV